VQGALHAFDGAKNVSRSISNNTRNHVLYHVLKGQHINILA
jgi:hypothetical protein